MIIIYKLPQINYDCENHSTASKWFNFQSSVNIINNLYTKYLNYLQKIFKVYSEIIYIYITPFL